MPAFKDRLQHAWNAFTSRDPTPYRDYGVSYSVRPDRVRPIRSGEKSIVNSIYNRISVDCASIDIRHVKEDENHRFVNEINDGLNNIFTIEANIDQTPMAFIIDIVTSMFDEGVVAAVPIDTTINPNKSSSYDINTMRTGRIIEWYPRHVKVHLYDDNDGVYKDVVLPKSQVAIIENPFYATMNEPNSTLKRLIRKINLLDQIDEQNGAGKLDLIIQLPYTVRTDTKRAMAEQRRKDIEVQLAGSKYGIAYADATEKITQLNRSVDNTLEKQVDDLTSKLYNQLGLTEEIFKGTADEKSMTNYYNRTIEPIMTAIVQEFKRKFLTKTARTQGQSIMFFRDSFKLIPLTELANVADVLSRNAIVTSNEFRGKMGMVPSDDPNADKLMNNNLYPDQQGVAPTEDVDPATQEAEEGSPMMTPISELMDDEEEY